MTSTTATMGTYKIGSQAAVAATIKTTANPTGSGQANVTIEAKLEPKATELWGVGRIAEVQVSHLDGNGYVTLNPKGRNTYQATVTGVRASIAELPVFLNELVVAGKGASIETTLGEASLRRTRAK